jgi:hypothetical protein
VHNDSAAENLGDDRTFLCFPVKVPRLAPDLPRLH